MILVTVLFVMCFHLRVSVDDLVFGVTSTHNLPVKLARRMLLLVQVGPMFVDPRAAARRVGSEGGPNRPEKQVHSVRHRHWRASSRADSGCSLGSRDGLECTRMHRFYSAFWRRLHEMDRIKN